MSDRKSVMNFPTIAVENIRLVVGALKTKGEFSK